MMQISTGFHLSLPQDHQQHAASSTQPAEDSSRCSQGEAAEEGAPPLRNTAPSGSQQSEWVSHADNIGRNVGSTSSPAPPGKAQPDKQEASTGSRPASGTGSKPPHVPHPLHPDSSPASSQQQEVQTPHPAPGTANARLHEQAASRPMSREGAGAGYAAQAEARIAQQKVAAAEAAGYIAPGLRLIDVLVEQGPGLPHRMLRMLIDYTQQGPKPYLGGLRNKLSGTVYHHATTQVQA